MEFEYAPAPSPQAKPVTRQQLIAAVQDCLRAKHLAPVDLRRSGSDDEQQAAVSSLQTLLRSLEGGSKFASVGEAMAEFERHFHRRVRIFSLRKRAEVAAGLVCASAHPSGMPFDHDAAQVAVLEFLTKIETLSHDSPRWRGIQLTDLPRERSDDPSRWYSRDPRTGRYEFHDGRLKLVFLAIYGIARQRGITSYHREKAIEALSPDLPISNSNGHRIGRGGSHRRPAQDEEALQVPAIDDDRSLTERRLTVAAETEALVFLESSIEKTAWLLRQPRSQRPSDDSLVAWLMTDVGISENDARQVVQGNLNLRDCFPPREPMTLAERRSGELAWPVPTSMKEVASALGRKPGAVRVAVHRVRCRLPQHLEQRGTKERKAA